MKTIKWLARFFIFSILIVLSIGIGHTQVKNNSFYDLLQTGEHFTFTQQDPILNVSYFVAGTRWMPLVPNGHVIIYNHGLQSHRAWFFGTAEALAAQGFTIYAFDRIGSGTSSPGVSVRSVTHDYVESMGHIRDWKLFLETLDLVIQKAITENPNAQIHLWGNSFGAKIVTSYLMNNPNASLISSVIFTTPGLYSNTKSMPLPFSSFELLMTTDAHYFPSPIIERDGDNGATWFTEDPYWFDKIKTDNLATRQMTKLFFLNVRSMDNNIRYSQSTQLNLIPRLYLMVKHDAMMDNDKMLKHISLYQKQAWYKFYEGGHEHKHLLMFGPDKNEVISDIVTFLTNDLRQIRNLHYFKPNGHSEDIEKDDKQQLQQHRP